MKLLMAIVWNDHAGDVVAALNEAGIGVTRISTSGGFWRRGNVTLMVAVEDAQIDQVLEIINSKAGPSVQVSEAAQSPYPPHRATVFVLNVDSFARY